MGLLPEELKSSPPCQAGLVSIVIGCQGRNPAAMEKSVAVAREELSWTVRWLGLEKKGE